MDNRPVSTFFGKMAVNIWVQVFVSVYIFISLGYTPRTRIAGSVSSCVLYLLKKTKTV